MALATSDLLPRREREALASLASHLRQAFGTRLREIRLFGSGARGQYGPDSDLDVAVVIAGITRDDFVQATRLASEASLDADVLIALLPMAPEHLDRLRRTEQRLARDMDNEGVSL